MWYTNEELDPFTSADGMVWLERRSEPGVPIGDAPFKELDIDKENGVYCGQITRAPDLQGSFIAQILSDHECVIHNRTDARHLKYNTYLCGPSYGSFVEIAYRNGDVVGFKTINSFAYKDHVFYAAFGIGWQHEVDTED